MPELPTSQAFLEQSALLLEAYPDTRITTKYSFPTTTPSAKRKRAKSEARKAKAAETSTTPTETTPAPATTTTTAPVAALVLKTYNPAAGICLKYRTNKIAEVGRLITGLGKLAGGADVASLGLSGPAAAAGDVEMVDVGGEEAVPPVVPAQGKGQQGQGQAQGQGQGGKGKKKSGKGKR